MNLPNLESLLSEFASFLLEAKLSSISVKNYLSDLRHFLRYCQQEYPSVNIREVFQSLSKYVNFYTENQKSLFTPTSSLNRRLASIRRFETFFRTHHNIFENAQVIETEQNTSPSQNNQTAFNQSVDDLNKDLTTKKILDLFKSHLQKEKKTHSTVKNYLSDLYHFFAWIAKDTPFTARNLDLILSETQLTTYVLYLKLTHTSVSVINRRTSSIKKLSHFCFLEKFIPTDPFERKIEVVKLSPLSWFRRLIPKPSKPSSAPRNRIAVIYDKYNSLPFTPYLHLALLVLATTTMAFLGYNQIIKQAKPSSAATALTPPKRQLSFQGRLSDSSGTPITTSVSVTFKLFNVGVGGTALYDTGVCTIDPDQDGIFNTLIGGGTCGSEITSSVFTDNRDVYLEVQVGGDAAMTPRQAIATVGYALNSETLQGYPAANPATINSVPVFDNSGNLNIGITSPSLVSTSGTFNLTGQALSLTTAANSGGDIILQPDSLASGQILALGGTTTEDSLRVTNANLTTGALISGYVGNDTTTATLLELSSGSTETNRFMVYQTGEITATASSNINNGSAMILNNLGAGDIFSASQSGVSKFTLSNTGNVTIATGADYHIGTVGLGDTGPSNTTSGAYLVGLYDDAMAYVSSSTSVQSAIKQLDTAIGTIAPGAGYWTRSGSSLFPATITDSIGIGTTNPGAKLHVKSATGVAGYIISDTTDTTSTGKINVVSLQNAGVEKGWFGFGSSSNNSFAVANLFSDGDIIFRTNSANVLNVIGTGAVANSLNINAGNVGIGTTNPGYKLDVVGALNLGVGNSFSIGGTSVLTANVLGVGVTSSSLTQVGALTSGSIATGFGNINIGSSITTTSILSVGVGNSFQVDANGDITRIKGVTYSWPSSIPSNNYVLQAQTDGTLAWVAAAAGSGDITAVGSMTSGDAFADTTADDDWLGLGATAGRIEFDDQATDEINFLDANVGIGTTTPGYKLDIVGGLNLGVGNSFSIAGTSVLTANTLGVGVTSSSLTQVGTLVSLNVGVGNSFQVDTNGDIIKLKGLTYAWPSAHVSNGFLQDNGSGTLVWTTGIGASSAAFNTITSGTNTGATMTVGTGASLTFSGTGVVNASQLQGATWGAPLGIGTTTPGTGAFTTLSASGNLTVGTGSSFQVTAATGNVTVASGVGIDTVAAGILALGNVTATTIGIGGTAATTLNFGAGGVLNRTINIGTGYSIDTINIGTGTTGADVITIGSANAGAVSLLGGTNSLIDFPNFDVATNGSVNLGTGASFSIGGTSVLSANVLGVGVTSSSLTQVGTLVSLNVGVGNSFQIDSNGNVTKINGQTYSWPTSQTPGNYLQVGVGGSLTWATVTAGIGGTGTTNYIPKWSNSSALANSLLYDTGTAIGIGTTNPGYTLDIAGGLNLGVGNSFSIGGTSVLTANILGVGVTSSSLTSVGTLVSLNVGVGNSFQIDSSGNIIKLNNITTSFPSAQGGAGTVLVNNGSGTLSWLGVGSTGTVGFWTQTATSIQPASSVDLIPNNAVDNLGDSSNNWNNLYLAGDILVGSTQTIDLANQILTGTGTNWSTGVGTNFGVGGTNPAGKEFYVVGDAQVTGTLLVDGTSQLTGNVTIGIGGTGKLDVGTVDPPYTINGEKYATYLTGMVGVKEEVTGNIYTTQFIDGVGYRTLIDLDQQTKGSDIWLFSKTTDIKNNINKLSVLLTGEGQTKTWYELDKQNKILALYSSSPTNISYRLTAPRFDSANWSNIREGNTEGFVINDPDNNQSFVSQFDELHSPNLIAQLDGTYQLVSNNQEIKEVSSFKNSLIANLRAGSAVVIDLVVGNLTIRQKLITPIADIDQLKVNNATISGTLYAEKITGPTIDKLDEQLDLLSEKYSTASAILADLQAKYSTYTNLTSTPSADILFLSPLATSTASLPTDLPTDILADSIFTKSISSFDTDLYIQPTGDKPVHLLANLMTLYPDGKILINGDLIITGTLYANNIDTKTATISGTLALGKGEIASDSSKLISLFNNYGEVVGSVDASGSANFGELTTPGLIIASGNNNSATNSANINSNASIGTASIATNSAEIFINNNKVTDSTLIYITPVSDTANQVLYVKSKQSGSGFTVASPQPASSEYFFNYWLVQTK